MLESFFNDGFAHQLMNKFIIKDDNGVYYLYGKYNIISNKSKKTFEVFVQGTHTHFTFYSLKNAVTWCICDKRMRIVDSDRVNRLDKDVFRVETSLQIFESLIKKTRDMDQKLIYMAKQSQEKIKKKNIKYELERLIKDANHWQLSQFNNENSTKKINTL